MNDSAASASAGSPHPTSEDPDAPLVEWLREVFASGHTSLVYRVLAANILLAHIAKWGQARGTAGGFAHYELAKEVRNVLRALALTTPDPKTDQWKDDAFEARLSAARAVLL